MGEYEKFQVVNRNERRVDALKLALGRGIFVDDEPLPGMLHVKMLWSPHAHARIAAIDTSEAERVPGVRCILHAFNVPQIPYTTAGQGYPEPSPYDATMFPRKVRYVGDRVAAVAADTEKAALLGVHALKVTYEALDAVFDPERALEPGAPRIHEEPDPRGIADTSRNLAAHFHAQHGDVEACLRESDVVIDRTYRVPWQQHCPAEPHCAITYLDENHRLVVRVATQVPFHSRRILSRILEIPVARIRVVKPRIGGGFGGKQEILLEDVPALVTLRTGRPARFVYTRTEEFVSARCRHPQIIRMRTGVKRDGTILAQDLQVLGNTGAYGAHALTVQMCTGGKTLPLYRSKSHRFDMRCAYTNTPNAGAFRGYGGPQGFFALESQMDLVAAAIGMDPLEFRRRNVIGPGDENPLARALGEGKEGVPQRIRSSGMQECIRRGMEAIGWDRRGTLPADGPRRRGIGMSCLMHGSGIPGIDMGAAFIKLNDDGSFNVTVGATDLGTGSDTVLAQIAAEALGVDLKDIIIHSSDTDFTPFDKGAYASSTTYISGMSVKKAAEGVLHQLIRAAAEIWGCDPSGLRAEKKAVRHPDGRRLTFAEICLSTFYVRNQHQIMDHASHCSQESPPPFAAHFAEVEVDTETGRVKVLKYVAAVDCGVAINPAACEGQNEGGAITMMGYALAEDFNIDGAGKVRHDSFRDYKMFGSLDAPEFQSILVPTYEPTGPFGAKSVAEIPTDGPAPTIANAIHDAIGIRFYEIPITAEKVRQAWLAKQSDERSPTDRPTASRAGPTAKAR